jgi:hypothetical protein
MTPIPRNGVMRHRLPLRITGVMKTPFCQVTKSLHLAQYSFQALPLANGQSGERLVDAFCGWASLCFGVGTDSSEK